MSLPRRDPNFSVAELQRLGDEFLAAGKAYWEALHKAGMGGAVGWIEDTEKGLVIFTRGEYRDVLMQGIPQIAPIYHFGAACGDDRTTK